MNARYPRLVGAIGVLLRCRPAPRRRRPSASSPDAPGFLLGLWHGFIFPVACVVSLFTDKVDVYAVPNNGGWYDFGYFIGIVVLGVGARSSTATNASCSTLMPLLEARKQYKPFEYPWAFEYWKRQQQIHWMPEEVPLGEDCRDWAQKLTDHERNLLTQIFRFFTQADVEVQDCYHDKYGRVFKPTEIKMMLTAFSQHGDGAHRRLLASARHDRHARERIWHVPPV